MQAHLNKECLGIPNNAKSQTIIPTEFFQNLTPSDIIELPSNTINTNTNLISSDIIELSSNLTNINIPISETNRPTKRTKLSTLDNFIDRMNEEEQQTLEFLLAQALFSAGVPFTFVENPFIIQFFHHLRPSFRLPNRKKLANELLDEVYEEVKIEADEQISKAKTLCMVSDGWSNINRESV